MGELLQNDVALIGPTKYLYEGCTIGDALRNEGADFYGVGRDEGADFLGM
jgi:hypothetical protein